MQPLLLALSQWSIHQHLCFILEKTKPNAYISAWARTEPISCDQAARWLHRFHPLVPRSSSEMSVSSWLSWGSSESFCYEWSVLQRARHGTESGYSPFPGVPAVPAQASAVSDLKRAVVRLRFHARGQKCSSAPPNAWGLASIDFWKSLGPQVAVTALSVIKNRWILRNYEIWLEQASFSTD